MDAELSASMRDFDYCSAGVLCVVPQYGFWYIIEVAGSPLVDV